MGWHKCSVFLHATVTQPHWQNTQAHFLNGIRTSPHVGTVFLSLNNRLLLLHMQVPFCMRFPACIKCMPATPVLFCPPPLFPHPFPPPLPCWLAITPANIGKQGNLSAAARCVTALPHPITSSNNVR